MERLRSRSIRCAVRSLGEGEVSFFFFSNVVPRLSWKGKRHNLKIVNLVILEIVNISLKFLWGC